MTRLPGKGGFAEIYPGEHGIGIFLRWIGTEVVIRDPDLCADLYASFEWPGIFLSAEVAVSVVLCSSLSCNRFSAAASLSRRLPIQMHALRASHSFLQGNDG